MRIDNVTDPVYYPNSFADAPAADTDTYAEQAVWAADGEMVRAAYTLHAEDDDFGQANTLITEVMDDAARDRLVDTVSGILAELRRDEVLPARLRVLAQHRQGRRRSDRGGHAEQGGVSGDRASPARITCCAARLFRLAPPCQAEAWQSKSWRRCSAP